MRPTLAGDMLGFSEISPRELQELNLTGGRYGDSPDPSCKMHIIWTIIIGFVAGVIAKFITPGDNEPSGFVLTTILGIVGAFVATYLGQAIGWYRADEGAGLIGAIVGAVIVLVIWGLIAGRRRRPI
jgi:uncharacterized membrane protein YeaQ/YmgE (transglycosylase-associated protein family)